MTTPSPEVRAVAQSTESDPLADLTSDEAQAVDSFMDSHMYSHTISNSYAAFACNTRCRTEALAEAVRREVLVPRREARAVNPPGSSDQ